MRQFAEKAGAMAHAADAEQLGKRLSQVGERLSRAQVGAGAHAPASCDERNVLARVVGARRGRIVAVIGRHDKQILVSQQRQKPREPLVEALQIRGIPGHVVAMAVLGVEVHEVREDQTTVHVRHLALDFIHPRIVALGVNRAS